MIFKTCFTFILLMSISCTGAAAIPRYATDLQKYVESAKIDEKMIRMRISAATERLSDSQARMPIGDILLCGSGVCYRARTAGNTAIDDTARGTATVLSEVVIPRTTITDIHFSEPFSEMGLSGHLKLQAPLVIEQGFQGIELFITVRKQRSGQRTHFVPAQYASMYFNPESELVHYAPSTTTVAALSRGVTLSIPSGALRQPYIFHVGVLDAGDAFPKIDIYPYIDLNKTATVEAKALRAVGDSDEMIVPLHPAVPHGAPAPLPASASGPASRIILKRTTVIEPSTLEKATPAGRVQPQAQPQATGSAKSCAEYLAQPVVFTLLNAMLLQTGAVRIKACENIRPNLHMVYVNTGDKRIRFSLPYQLSTTGSGNAPQLRLQRGGRRYRALGRIHAG